MAALVDFVVQWCLVPSRHACLSGAQVAEKSWAIGEKGDRIQMEDSGEGMSTSYRANNRGDWKVEGML